jgi:hypothetical protein
VNAPENPNGAAGYGRSGLRVIPGPLGHNVGQFGMIWGGDFTGTPDPMHFEIHVSPDQIHGGAVTFGGLGSPVGKGGLLDLNAERPGDSGMTVRWLALSQH